jgi:hypothetical protein
MRKYLIILAGVLAALVAHAGDYQSRVVPLTGTTTAADSVTGTVAVVNGELIQVHVILGTATNIDVDITVEPEDTTEDSFTLYSEDDVAADTIKYLVFDRHSSAGTALTSDPPGPHVVVDPVQIVVSDFAQTGKTVNVKLIWK